MENTQSNTHIYNQFYIQNKVLSNEISDLQIKNYEYLNQISLLNKRLSSLLSSTLNFTNKINTDNNIDFNKKSIDTTFINILNLEIAHQNQVNTLLSSQISSLHSQFTQSLMSYMQVDKENYKNLLQLKSNHIELENEIKHMTKLYNDSKSYIDSIYNESKNLQERLYKERDEILNTIDIHEKQVVTLVKKGYIDKVKIDNLEIKLNKYESNNQINIYDNEVSKRFQLEVENIKSLVCKYNKNIGISSACSCEYSESKLNKKNTYEKINEIDNKESVINTNSNNNFVYTNPIPIKKCQCEEYNSLLTRYEQLSNENSSLHNKIKLLLVKEGDILNINKRLISEKEDLNKKILLLSSKKQEEECDVGFGKNSKYDYINNCNISQLMLAEIKTLKEIMEEYSLINSSIIDKENKENSFEGKYNELYNQSNTILHMINNIKQKLNTEETEKNNKNNQISNKELECKENRELYIGNNEYTRDRLKIENLMSENSELKKIISSFKMNLIRNNKNTNFESNDNKNANNKDHDCLNEKENMSLKKEKNEGNIENDILKQTFLNLKRKKDENEEKGFMYMCQLENKDIIIHNLNNQLKKIPKTLKGFSHLEKMFIGNELFEGQVKIENKENELKRMIMKIFTNLNKAIKIIEYLNKSE